MAPLPQNNTERYRMNYLTVLKEHSIVCRTDTVSPSAFGTYMDNWWTTLGPAVFPRVIQSVEYAASGSDVFNPVTTGIEGNTYGTGSPSADKTSNFISFVGRTTGAHRARIFVYGTDASGAVDFRINALEDDDIDDTILLLNGADAFWLGIDGLKPIYKNYANAGVSAHWQKALRPG